MLHRLRKLFVGLLTVAVLSASYLFYRGADKTPPIVLDSGAEFSRTVDQTDVNRPAGRVGTIRNVGVGTVRKSRFTEINKTTGKLEREFGFEALLHQEGNEWEIEKPYMNMYERDFKCLITADKGDVRVETVGKDTSPKDARLTGNVVIHILPESSSSLKESRLYLDNIVFISEKSHFSTAGPVRFVSKEVRMLGRGLEGVYSGELERLEYLRINHLEHLRVKTSRAALFGETAKDHRADRPPDPDVPSRRPVPAPDTHKAATAPISPTTRSQRGQRDYYRCIFGKNVLIDTPEQIVLADEEISISSILWAEDPNEEPAESDISDASDSGPAPAFRQTLVAARADSAQTPQEHPNQHLADIVVTCDNGILFVPMDSSMSLADFASEEHELQPLRASVHGGPTAGRTRLTAAKIDYSASSGDTLAAGPLEIVFDINDPVGESNDTVPVRVTARDEAQFLPASNQIIFKGDCRCLMLSEDANVRQHYTLSAPRLTVDLSKDKPHNSADSALDIKHLTADGGTVRLETIKKTAQEKLLGGIRLDCRRFEYAAVGQVFSAAGPGQITFKNLTASQTDAPQEKFSFKKQCWTLVRDFETLQYSLELNTLIAYAGLDEPLRVDYFPIDAGRAQYDRQTIVTAAHVEADFVETVDEQLELATLMACGGVTYEDEDKYLEGGTLFYDAIQSLVTVQADELYPCYLDGVLVDAIEWNLETGNLKFEVVGPGALQGRQ
ncbi:MAG: hypothetical protein ACYS4W_07640 [Planctomycetota bacterium]|jgi:hypothetical protein